MVKYTLSADSVYFTKIFVNIKISCINKNILEDLSINDFLENIKICYGFMISQRLKRKKRHDLTDKKIRRGLQNYNWMLNQILRRNYHD